MIRRLLCWLGFHKWYTLVKCNRPVMHKCYRAYCDNCPYIKNLKTICEHCGKVKK